MKANILPLISENILKSSKKMFSLINNQFSLQKSFTELSLKIRYWTKKNDRGWPWNDRALTVEIFKATKFLRKIFSTVKLPWNDRGFHSEFEEILSKYSKYFRLWDDRGWPWKFSRRHIFLEKNIFDRGWPWNDRVKKILRKNLDRWNFPKNFLIFRKTKNLRYRLSVSLDFPLSGK